MDPAVEVRNLPIEVKSNLIKILEKNESWKKLMAIIPEELSSETHRCDITQTNPAKYSSEDVHTIENLSEKRRRQSAEVLLREWGTSGRVRPCLGHLQHLLIRAQLFRAADYLTVDVLNQERPHRPTEGPAALVTLDSDEEDSINRPNLTSLFNSC